MRRSLIILLFSVLPVVAQDQPFTLGIKGGVPAQTPLGTVDRMPFILGPTFTVRISLLVSVESGVLFHRMGQSVGTGVFLNTDNTVTLSPTSQRARALEIPVLAKFHLLGADKASRPFVTLGPSIRRTSVQSGLEGVILSGTQLTPLATLPAPKNAVNWSVDPTVGAGLDIKTGRFHIEPEVRYSYWGAGKDLPVRKNQVSFLLGFRM
jgi:hypothetical protein